MPRLLTVLSLAITLTLGPWATATAAVGDGGAELALLARINDERTSRGMAPLRMTDDLRSHARRHSYEMDAGGAVAHTANLDRHVCCWRQLGENVGRTDGSIADVHAGFMASRTHRALILDPRYDEIGVGVVRDGGAYWVTEVFRGR